MMTLITGLPGNGKTLYALQYVADLSKREGRQVWYHNINGLSDELGWKPIPSVSMKLDGQEKQVPQWWLAPANAIVLIDEAQNCGFGVRPRGQVPEHAQRLETHRHLGLDLVLITQGPNLIDAHDRTLCEIHFHVMRTFGLQRAVIHEFRPVRDGVLRSRKGSIEHRWKYPKHIFKLYKSAEAHTHRRRIPARVLVFLALPFLIGGVSWYTWHSYLDPHRDALKAPQVKPGEAGALANGGAFQGAGARSPVRSAADYARSFQPRVSGLAYTAPAYDDVTKPVEAPIPAACVSSVSKGCRCYTQQGTALQTTLELCQSIVSGGFYVAWAQKAVAQPSVQPSPVRAQDQPEGRPNQAVGWDVGRRGDGPAQPSASVLGRSGAPAGPEVSGGRGKALPKPTQPAA